LLLSPDRCFTSVEALKTAQRESGKSIGIVKPRPGAVVRIEQRDPKEQVEWEGKHEAILAQADFLERPKELDYMPFRPVVRFKCAGTECTTTHKCGVLDWEIYQLARRSGWEKAKAKLEELLNLNEYETQLMMGNFRLHLGSFGIVGLFYPKRSEQGLLL
jgi:hypothetical protein